VQRTCGSSDLTSSMDCNQRMIHGTGSQSGSRCLYSVTCHPSVEARRPEFMKAFLMQHKKPVPLVTGCRRPICPVCGQTSYSRAGIHPQCAVKQADNKRLERIRERGRAESDAQSTHVGGAWQKICPKCKASLHVRRKACDCGFEFAARAASSAAKGAAQ
jgi:hypothetical protein